MKSIAAVSTHGISVSRSLGRIAFHAAAKRDSMSSSGSADSHIEHAVKFRGRNVLPVLKLGHRRCHVNGEPEKHIVVIAVGIRDLVVDGVDVRRQGVSQRDTRIQGKTRAVEGSGPVVEGDPAHDVGGTVGCALEQLLAGDRVGSRIPQRSSEHVFDGMTQITVDDGALGDGGKNGRVDNGEPLIVDVVLAGEHVLRPS